MSANRKICNCKNVDYIQIRKAMIDGARTIEEVKKKTRAATDCGRCEGEIKKILASVCGCANVSLEDVIKAVQNGADTVEKVGEITGAGTRCGKCKPLIQNIIDLGR